MFNEGEEKKLMDVSFYSGSQKERIKNESDGISFFKIVFAITVTIVFIWGFFHFRKESSSENPLLTMNKPSIPREKAITVDEKSIVITKEIEETATFTNKPIETEETAISSKELVKTPTKEKNRELESLMEDILKELAL